MHISNSQQIDIFSDDERQLHYAELCNALYERELASLSQHKTNDISLLQRKIAGLRHHVQRAAYSLLQHQSPLQVDVHNASWQARQAAKCMANNYNSQKTQQWFTSGIQIGCTVAIHVKQLGGEHIELDSIDRVELSSKHIHANKFGWFDIDGESTEDNHKHADILSQRLLKPTKAILTAACCGHSWDHKGKSQQRALSLRELLLSVSINWKTFR
ncbi:MAG: hypothetical protein QMC38_12525 [Sinobacterium sp.]